MIASTCKEHEHAYLYELGAKEIIDRAELLEINKPLQKTRWVAAIDSVGGQTLMNVLASTHYSGCVTTCGLAQDASFKGNVMPFILRNITLYGIDSVMRPLPDRIEAWQRIADLIDTSLLQTIRTEITLEDTIDYAEKLMNGDVRGRIVIRM